MVSTPPYFHPLDTPDRLPARFNNPFDYSPDPLAVKAATKLQEHLTTLSELHEEMERGKMFGVLVVKSPDGQIGFLAAYSGLLGGRNDLPYFVPAVFDLLHPGGHFKNGEKAISALNAEIQNLETSEEYHILKEKLKEAIDTSVKQINDYKVLMLAAKSRRDSLRAGTCTDGINENPPKESESRWNEAELIRESQYMKAELRRIKKRHETAINEAGQAVLLVEDRISKLKEERMQASERLQEWIFRQFKMLNSNGENKDLVDIFRDFNGSVPPSGAGECCAPKLLQYAFKNELAPICMAEFWWGHSPNAEVRQHLNFYPACRGKCRPILGFMLSGMDIDTPQPSVGSHIQERKLETLFEDPYLAVVFKPEGMLSVRGKSEEESVQSIMAQKFPGAMIVHRLDMDTSGLMIVAKDLRTYTELQRQFTKRSICKTYIALLDGQPSQIKGQIIRPDNHDSQTYHQDYIHGQICLPLSPDIQDRPRQMVDTNTGKSAITDYEILESDLHSTRIKLHPLTGRTHQLRVHCAHPDGLGAPIKGDPLYGKPADRMYLHAEEITFVHPHTLKSMTFKKECGF